MSSWVCVVMSVTMMVPHSVFADCSADCQATANGEIQDCLDAALSHIDDCETEALEDVENCATLLTERLTDAEEEYDNDEFNCNAAAAVATNWATGVYVVAVIGCPLSAVGTAACEWATVEWYLIKQATIAAGVPQFSVPRL